MYCEELAHWALHLSFNLKRLRRTGYGKRAIRGGEFKKMPFQLSRSLQRRLIIPVQGAGHPSMYW